ncbi:prepilin peptidase [Candidatus Pelagibacter communis]|uniref:prepilin peptidase n=1 Tax=Pelagibacter ubique TaxID=198252 RepID=UPI000B2A0941|nr:A24 family peptidase [Candidatus Pelagibacter ubique]
MDLIFLIIIGGLWGSFANVCIVRLPEDKGVVSGRSNCPKCKKQINWYDNIPIISYFILNGKCRKCKKPISFQYVVVELLSIVSFVTIYLIYGFSFTTLLLIILSLGFIIIFFIDLKHFIIPDVITFPLMALGFIKSFIPNLDPLFPYYVLSLIGGVFGYGIIWGIIFFYKQVKKKEGMGLGDAKLLAVIGFWFGLDAVPFIIFLSSTIALISVSPDLIKKSKKMSTQIPFGPYIIAANLIFLLLEDQLKFFIL